MAQVVVGSTLCSQGLSPSLTEQLKYSSLTEVRAVWLLKRGYYCDLRLYIKKKKFEVSNGIQVGE